VQGIVAFISDFGLDDTWVGVCHAVIWEACPQAQVVDLAHQIPPFDIRKGAATAAAAVYQLPEAIHLVVVDPGVGGGRDDLCIVARSGTRLVGPDNGVLLPAAERAGGIVEAYAIDPVRFEFEGPLATFHARDVLAPAAAALACGVEPAATGRPVAEADLTAGPFGLCRLEGDSVTAEVLETDRFGSLRLNVPGERLTELGLDVDALEVSLGHNRISVPLGRTFSDVEPGEPVAVVDSSGWLTIALNRDRAQDRYGAFPGQTAHVRAGSGD
jgi:S-adenosylmethionine hydrolase